MIYLSNYIEANAETLMRQASITADVYMTNAIEAIDRKFGEGFSKKHPELVSEFMKVAASDFNHAIISQQLRAGLDEIARAITSAADTLA